MRTQVTNVSTFLQATNQLMLNYGIFQIPVALNGDSLSYGRVGVPIKPPERMVFMGAKIPLDEFMVFLPVAERPAPDELDRGASDGHRDMFSQWWSVQRFVNKTIAEMEILGEPRPKALDLRRHGEEAERQGQNADAAWAFLESAVILYKLGMPRDTVTVEFFGSARNFETAALCPSSAIIYESAFNSSHSDEHAVGAAKQWLESVRQEPDEGTMRLRVNRGLVYAAHKPYEEPYRDLLRESGKMHGSAKRYFAAGADYMRAAWSMVQRGTPSKAQWAGISLFLASAADMFRAKEDDALAPQVHELSAIASKFTGGA